MRILVLLALLALSLPAVVKADSAGAEAVWREMNFARQQPRAYARLVAAAPSRDPSAVREAVRFLEKVRPLPPLRLSAAMSAGALSHVASQGARGTLGHRGKNGSSPSARLERFGKWGGSVGENIHYGASDARSIVITLIVDAGVRGRGHRKNIFNSAFSVAGVARGPHARFGSLCVIDFAGSFRPSSGYAEKSTAAAVGRLTSAQTR